MKNPLSERNQAGFTLVELLVVMAVFIMVLIIASDAFNRILTQSGRLSRSAESNIEGVAGLEMFRHDLSQAGFGLPWSSTAGALPAYNEAANAPASGNNDSPNGIPRAIAATENLSTAGYLGGTDYLSLKGSSLAQTQVSQKWSYVNYSSVGSSPPKIWPSNNLNNNDNVIVLRRSFNSSGYNNQLLFSGAQFYTTYNSAGFSSAQEAFSPTVAQQTYFLYGITDAAQAPRMPFNRTDYYVRTKATSTNLPSSCADNTGFLYKAILNHNDGQLTEIPILACVGDMQVVLGWDMNDDGVIDAYSNADGTAVSGGSATDVQNMITNAKSSADNAATFRNRLKLIKVYLLAQDGVRDLNFTNQNPITVGNSDETALTRQWSVASINTNKWTNYRWKVYRIVFSPKNLDFN